MKNYKLLSGVGLLALMSVACASHPAPAESAGLSSRDACENHAQNMKDDWDAPAVRTDPGEVVWRPGIAKTVGPAEVVEDSWRPGLRESKVATASCMERGQVTY